jgi:hypothetical protein
MDIEQARLNSKVQNAISNVGPKPVAAPQNVEVGGISFILGYTNMVRSLSNDILATTGVRTVR